MLSLYEKEAEKYKQTWDIPSYHDYSHGENYADLFMEITGAQPGDTVIDLGCGTGRGGQELEAKGLRPTYLDLENYNDNHPFLEQSLWERIPQRNPRYNFGLCCDVMEHLPPEYTMLAIRNMLDACEGLFLSICFQDESFGAIIGETLHLTVMPFTWWRDHLSEMGNLVEARDFSPPTERSESGKKISTLKVGVFYVK